MVMERNLNWYCIVGLFSIGSLAACTQGKTTEQDHQRQALIKEIQDSLELDSFRRAEALEASLVEENQPAEKAPANQATYTPPSYTQQEPVYESQPVYDPAPAGDYEMPQKTKKGWSDAAKGTAIGAGVGAGMGILIDKDKRGRGAAIGALIGGGSGYLIGRKKDRQSGRVQK